ncbi:glyoxylate/hydroxypyruvate reductase A [Comamonas sp.]|uniref:2-hydroxyacid dehydrogenase n=1 Tax=Comamonas sp. TaxID=34028 RepID=UPI00289BA81E|nr:glyoxylate/hydroxypyruvate reductase A [Comamonas sp.]
MASSTPLHLIIKSGGSAAIPEWTALFAEFAPQVVVHDWNTPPADRSLVDFAMVWEPDTGVLASFPQLKAIFSSAAGVDHILADGDLPAHLPIVRMVTGESQQRMAEFCLMATLMLQKNIPRALAQHRQQQWIEFNPPYVASELRVGILGLGTLGAAAAQMLRAVGYPVQGWSQTRKQIEGVTSYCGQDELPEFLRSSQVLICLLPDTPSTRGILNAALFAQLPAGAQLVNAGRGTQLNSADLVAALDSGQLAGALLDVTEPEPLPAGSPLWTHPRVILTPHIAASASRRAKARQVALSMAQWQAGQALDNCFDRARGY